MKVLQIILICLLIPSLSYAEEGWNSEARRAELNAQAAAQQARANAAQANAVDPWGLSDYVNVHAYSY